MRKYFNTVISTTTGKPISGAQVRVKDAAGDLATLYSDDGGTALSNPVTTDANGLYEFYAENGSYDFEFLFGGELVQTITDVEISEDVTALQLVAATGAELVGVEDGRTLAAWLSGRTVDASKYGLSTSKSAADNTTAMQAAIDDLEGGEHPVTLLVAPGTYNLGTAAISGGNLHIWAYGATFTGSAVQFSCDSDEFRIFGARIIDTDTTGANFGFNFVGDRNELHDCALIKSPNAGGYHGYIQLTATNCVLNNVALRGSNGIFVEGTGHRFSGIDAIARPVGGDDLFAIKARNQTTGDIVISDVKAEGYANVVAIGSEVGTLGAASASRAGRVQGVHASGLVARNCSYLAYIKPGAIDSGTAYDWRDGLVNNVRIEGIITDIEGARMVRPIVITCSRGALVSNVEIDAQASGRTYNAGGGEQRVGADIYIPDYSASTPPASAPTIRDIKIKLRCFDPYNGAAAGGSAPGDPFQNIARVAVQTAGHGGIGRVRLDVEGDGCSEQGILISSGLDDSVELERIRIRNIGGTSGIEANSDVSLGDIDVSLVTGWPVGSTSIVDTIYTAKEVTVSVGSFGAGVAADMPLWVAPRDCYVHSVLLVDGAGIALNATNYTTLSVINQVTSGAFVAAGTNVFTFTANTAVAAHLNSAIASANCLNIPKGTVLRFTKADTGTGAAVTNMRAIIRYIEHG